MILMYIITIKRCMVLCIRNLSMYMVGFDDYIGNGLSADIATKLAFICT